MACGFAVPFPTARLGPGYSASNLVSCSGTWEGSRKTVQVLGLLQPMWETWIKLPAPGFKPGPTLAAAAPAGTRQDQSPPTPLPQPLQTDTLPLIA